MQSTKPLPKVANFVMGLYHRQRKKSWPRVAKICQLNSGAHAQQIAKGLRPAPPHLIQMAANATIKGPKSLMKKIKRVAIPFLEKQQSDTHVYDKRGRRA
jgi:hypothetical protein